MTYLAFVLDDASRSLLLSRVPPRFEKVIAHHVTLLFPKTDGQVTLMHKWYEELRNGTDIDMDGPEVKVKVINHYLGEHIHAVGVEVNGVEGRRLGGFYHVTLSLEQPAKPVDSNKLSSPTALEPFELTGTVQLVD